MNKIINIIFILCPPKSGSTLYEILLGSHQEIFSIGERRVDSKICNCGSKIEECIFWSKINSMSNPRNIINDINENSNPKHFYELFNYILEYTGKKIILDSSKDINFLKGILKRKDLFKVEIIDLVRNPIDLVQIQKKKWLINKKEKGMNFYKSIFYIYIFWIKKFLIIEDITIVTKYSEIIYDKKKFLNQILGKMNLNLFNNIIVNKKHIHSLGGSGVRESYEKLKYDNNLDHLNFFEFLLSCILLMPLSIFQKIYLFVKK
jgi:hypothetical protein